MHLEVTKDNKWRNSGKLFFSEKPFFSENIFSEIFFYQMLCHLGPRKREANGCDGCIRNEFSIRIGTHEIFQLNDMSKIWQKHG